MRSNEENLKLMFENIPPVRNETDFKRLISDVEVLELYGEQLNIYMSDLQIIWLIRFDLETYQIRPKKIQEQAQVAIDTECSMSNNYAEF